MAHASLLLLVMLAGPGLTARAAAQVPAPPAEKPPPIIGMVTRDYKDPARRNWQGTGPRPLRTAIWYPADMVSIEETVFAAPPEQQFFVPVVVAAGAQLSQRAQKYPLVLLSHGTGGSAVMLIWLGRRLAAQGYIVAAVTHHGNSIEEGQMTPQGFRLVGERPKDLTAVLDQLLADPVFGYRIDRNRIGAAGFSLGGYTVIAAGGGIFSRREFDAFCNSPRRDFTCEPQPEFPEAWTKFEELKKTDPRVQEALRREGDSYRDSRIKAVFAIAPALGSGFTEAGLRRIHVPVHIVVGQADTVTPAATNAQRLAGLIKRAKLTILPGGVAHYTFLPDCAANGKRIAPICRDPEGVDRAAVHDQVSRLAFEFFEQVWAKR